jgi:aspartate/methionine/tyrosine aminotransferase
MKLEPFAMERLQSTWENRVAWNVSESGVHPLRVEEVAETDEERQAVLVQALGYPQTNGTVALRHAIAAMYPDATADHIQVTNGGSEANCVALLHLVEPGDDVVMMAPNYMQVRGLSRALGARVVPWPLVCDLDAEAARWRPDLEALPALVTARTKMILICNPNNPTGARLAAGELDEICRIAGRHGTWVLSDEIYRGAEIDGVDTATIFGRYERAIVTSGLSKAYGLPGLRIGWVVSAPSLVSELWGVHDYTTIAPGAVNDCLAQIALAPARRTRLIARTRGIIRTNYPILQKWIQQRSRKLFHVAPEAGAIAFVRYAHAINSTELIERLRDEKGVLVVPGDHFEMDGYLRIGFGHDPTHLTGSLNQIGELLDTLPDGPDAR